MPSLITFLDLLKMKFNFEQICLKQKNSKSKINTKFFIFFDCFKIAFYEKKYFLIFNQQVEGTISSKDSNSKSNDLLKIKRV